PAVTVVVVRPVAVELADAEVSVKPGDTAEVKGELIRRGAFAGPVTLRIDGLPGGVTAEPVTLAPDASEFTLTLAATAEAGDADARAQVKPAFRIGEDEYDNPPTPLSVKVAR